MKYSFEDIVNLKKMDNLLKTFYRITGITSSLVDNQGNILAQAGMQGVCKDFYQKNPATRKLCQEHRSFIISQMKEGKRGVYKCPHGLTKMTNPIFVVGEHMANFLITQFFLEPPDLVYYTEEVRRNSFDLDSFLEALKKVPLYSQEKAFNILDYYADLAQLLGETGLNNQHKLTEKESQAEEDQRKSRKRLLTILDSIDALVTVTDIETFEIIYINESGQKVWEGAIGRKCWEVFRENQEGPCEACPNQEFIKSETFPSTVPPFEIYYEGIERWFECRKRIMPWLNGRLVDISFNIDITERKRMEEEILKASKLESIGLLAGGIAHDFNNLLSVIWGNLSLARNSLEEESFAYQRLNNVEKAVCQARDLTNQLQTFARGGPLFKETSSLPQLVQEVASFTLSGSKVRYQLSFPRDLAYVDIDQGQISQVMQNIILNSLQAMPRGGTIEISAENLMVEKEQQKESLPFLKEGAYVKLIIQDDGEGIPQEHLKKLFDPFFTTRVKGAGMGLATSYSIIKRHGGDIRVESRPGEGTTFYVYFPATQGERFLEGKEEEEILYQGSGFILVMDDEMPIRNMVKEMLEYLGYKGKLAKDGGEAVEMYRRALKEGKAFDAAILDLTVPGSMGGREAAQKILQEDPQARLIVSSGYSKELEGANYEEMGFMGNIAKPYKMEKLSEVLNKTLKGRKGNDTLCS